MIETAFLADYPETIPTLAQWFLVQWSEYYAGCTPADLAQDFLSETNRDGLPIRLVAFTGDELAGTIILRDRAISTLPEYHPGLGGLFVAEQYRDRGIGTELVKAGMKVAQDQGYERVYATTVAAGGILERLGWRLVRSVSHGDEQLILYQCELAKVQPDT
jgi:RimJ/RimL family protein N-acetyltransferase